jgi:hypothetical protein
MPSTKFTVTLMRTDKSGKDVTATNAFIVRNAGYIQSYFQNLVIGDRTAATASARDTQLQYFKTYLKGAHVTYEHVKGNVFEVEYNGLDSNNIDVDDLINPNRSTPIYLTLASGTEKGHTSRGKIQPFYISSSQLADVPRLKTKSAKITVGLNSGFDMQAAEALRRGQITQMPERFYGSEDFIAEHANEIRMWYEGQVRGPYLTNYVTLFNIVHVKGNVFKITYIMNEKMVSLHGLVDPDDDGNDPLEIDGQRLLVSGRLLTAGRKPSATKARAASPKSRSASPSPKARAASPKSRSASPSPKSRSASPKSPRGCTLQTVKKYTVRKSPAYPANECCGAVMQGNDSKLYKSVASKSGVCRWVLA